MTERSIPRISLKNFDTRRDEIKQQLLDAAQTVGFFILHDQENPSPKDIDTMFEHSAEFFDLPAEKKGLNPFQRLLNTGYEYKAQTRPSTGTPDMKESLQLQLHRVNQNWPSEEEVGKQWREFTQEFILKCQDLSMNVLSCFAEGLGFPQDFFTKAHDISDPDNAQSTLRLLHYHDVTGQVVPPNYWRAGSHTDFDCLTILFTRTGDGGLEVCPGREAHTSFAKGDTWTPVPSVTGEIVVNIGDMLMAWSDDRFKSNFHRVRAPGIGENQKARYSIAWFNQANKDVMIQGPLKKYPTMTAKDYITQAMEKNFESLRKLELEKESASENTSVEVSG